MSLLAKKQNERAWDPFAELKDLSDQLSRALSGDSLFGRTNEGFALTNVDWNPSMNVSETDKAYMIRADLPDVKKEDVKVSCEQGILTIEGERKQEKKEDNERYHRVESSYGRFVRRFSLPSDADDAAIEATQKDGSLSIRIPKTKAKAPAGRQIKVS